MRVRTLAVALVAAGAIGLAGCGSDAGAGDQVPKSTPDISVPAGADVLSGGTGATATTSTSTTSTTATTGTTATTVAPSPAPAAGTTTAAPAPPAATADPSQTQ